MIFEWLFKLVPSEAMVWLLGGIFVFGWLYFPLEAMGLFNPVKKHHDAYQVLYAKISDGLTWDSVKNFKIAIIIIAVWIIWLLTLTK